jgi:hypothetical protein
MVADLIFWAKGKGYKLTGGELHRPAITAVYYASKGIGAKDSKHIDRLAVDLNLFIDGEYKTQTEDYQPLGEYWEWLGGNWGGRFKRKDGNHFEL